MWTILKNRKNYMIPLKYIKIFRINVPTKTNYTWLSWVSKKKKKKKTPRMDWFQIWKHKKKWGLWHQNTSRSHRPAYFSLLSLSLVSLIQSHRLAAEGLFWLPLVIFTPTDLVDFEEDDEILSAIQKALFFFFKT